MRRHVLVVVALVVGGCLQTGPGPEGGARPPVTERPAWSLDCSLAAANDAGYAQACVRRASGTPGSKAEMWTAVNPADPRNVVIGSKDMDPERGDGSVHVAFLDKRHDDANRLIDVTHAVSLDGGATWTNTRVTSASFEGERGIHQNGGPFIGDYLGIDAAGNEVWLGFPEAASTDVPVTAAARVVAS